ncbi:hypothetical protein BT96DRAFT_911948 [Gymnopus androsaceus JB14]|uniref:Uncharacterized protein n=1 Tax=Gymnopus androsaceus JB14 TaxID=1447944 RepID=A0A6A4IG60_9AGAR|nr:hypothetical protein BT96DRAFT_911948 [Gymnopus androsaceus JB14]
MSVRLQIWLFPLVLCSWPARSLLKTLKCSKYARIGYVVTQLTILGIYYYISMVVSRGFLPSII